MNALNHTLLAAIVVASPLAAAAGPVANPMQTAASAVADVRIAEGVLTGTLKDAAGTPVDGALVVVRQRGAEIARTATGRDGRYTVTGLRAGSYDIASGDVTRSVRLWEASVAPPAAGQTAGLTQPVGTVRSNNGCYDAGCADACGDACAPCVGGGCVGGSGLGGKLAVGGALVLGGAALAVAISNADDIDDLEDENDQLREELDALDDFVSANVDDD